MENAKTQLRANRHGLLPSSIRLAVDSAYRLSAGMDVGGTRMADTSPPSKWTGRQTCRPSGRTSRGAPRGTLHARQQQYTRDQDISFLLLTTITYRLLHLSPPILYLLAGTFILTGRHGGPSTYYAAQHRLFGALVATLPRSLRWHLCRLSCLQPTPLRDRWHGRLWWARDKTPAPTGVYRPTFLPSVAFRRGGVYFYRLHFAARLPILVGERISLKPAR